MTINRKTIIAGSAILAVVVASFAVVSAATGWRPWPDTTAHIDTTHTTAIAATVAAQELCGSETTTAQQITVSTSYGSIPGWVAGREVVGTVVGAALACSTTNGVTVEPAAAGPDDPITVTVPEPSIEYAWVDIDETTLPTTTERGVVDRVGDVFGCLFGSCDTSHTEIETVLRDGLDQIEVAALENEALEVAETEIRAMIVTLISAGRAGAVNVVFSGVRPTTAVTVSDVAPTTTTADVAVGTAIVVEVDPETGQQIVTER